MRPRWKIFKRKKTRFHERHSFGPETLGGWRVAEGPLAGVARGGWKNGGAGSRAGWNREYSSKNRNEVGRALLCRRIIIFAPVHPKKGVAPSPARVPDSAPSCRGMDFFSVGVHLRAARRPNFFPPLGAAREDLSLS